MHFLNKNKYRGFDEDHSAPSSVQSVDSYEIFGSTCSDLSDCEYCEERKRRCKSITYNAPYQSASTSASFGNNFRSAMERTESTPLLRSAPPASHYTATPCKGKSIRDSSSETLGQADFSSSEILSTYNHQFDKPPKSEKKKQSSLVTIFSVWNTIMGSSLLTMAWGVEKAGLPAALVLVALMAALCLYTAYLLITVNRHHGIETCEVPALCGRLLGGVAEWVAHAFSLLVLLGANIVYWILITNFLYFTVNYFMGLSSSNTALQNSTLLCPKHEGVNGSLITPAPVEETPYWGLYSTVPIYVAFIVYPLLNFKNVTFFTKFNSLGTLSVVYLLVFVLVKGFTWGINISSAAIESRVGMDAAVLSGMLALSFYIHNIIITIMSNNARQDNNGRDLTIAYVLVTLTYMLVGAVFYICFPLAKSCIEDNILNNFEMHDVMTAVARVLLLFQVVTVYPLVAFMLRTEAILLMPVRQHWKKRRVLTLLVNATIVFICILFACFCPSIGTIIRYTGAVSGLVHIFALPSLLQVRSLQLRGKLTWWKALFYIIIVIFGAVNLLMQFFIRE